MKLIAIDLDGTLLDEHSRISKANKDAILEVQKRGDLVTICSGRSLHDIKGILEHSGLACSIIGGNGAAIFHSDQMIQNLLLPSNTLSDIMQLLEEIDLHYEVYTNKGIFIKEREKTVLQDELKRLNATNKKYLRIIDRQYIQYHLLPVPSFKDISFSNLDPYKIFILSFDEKKLDMLKQQLEGRNDIYVTSGGTHSVEISHPHSSKGNALAKLADHININRQDIITIGDNFNDVSMFEIAGLRIAMENAVDVLKEEAEHITKHCNEDGVAYALHNYVLK